MRVKQRAQEGYLALDHRASPGISERDVARMSPDAPPGAGRSLWEMPTLGCPHCGKQQIVNPLRTRDRPWCQKCDAYICDDCKLVMVTTGKHRPFTAIIDEIQGRAAKGVPIIGAPNG